MTADWAPPTDLPDLRRVGVIAVDTETRDNRLIAKMGSGWPFGDGHLCGVSIAYHEGRENLVRSTFQFATRTAITSILRDCIVG